MLVAGCVAPKAPPPVVTHAAPKPPPPAPVARPAPPPAAAEDWRDVALTPGTWRYTLGKDGSIAAFGADPGAPLFVIQCAVAGREVILYRPGVTMAAAATLTTSFGTQPVATGAVMGGVGWRMAARDPALDRIAFSRGRFMVEGIGPRLVLPAWAEVARVIEDCRG
nr:hypothetical protein [Sphingomonas quercus]